MTRKSKKEATVRARAGLSLKRQQRQSEPDVVETIEEFHTGTVTTTVNVHGTAMIAPGAKYIVLDLEEEEECGFTGRVDELLGYDTESEDGAHFEDLGYSDDEDLEEVDSETVEEQMKPLLDAMSVLAKAAKQADQKWKLAERGLGYTGQSKRTRQRHEQQARKWQKQREEAKVSSDPQVRFMRQFTTKKEGEPSSVLVSINHDLDV
jgi:hypothetical protein